MNKTSYIERHSLMLESFTTSSSAESDDEIESQQFILKLSFPEKSFNLVSFEIPISILNVKMLFYLDCLH